MKCKVQAVFKNPRFRVVTIEEEDYILDAGRNGWNYIFPFFVWMIPSFVYKLDDAETVSKLNPKMPKQEKTTNAGLIGPALGIALASLLKPLIDYFDIPVTESVKYLMLGTALFLTSFLFLLVNHFCKKKLQNTVYLEDLIVKKILIRPESFKQLFLVIFYYIGGTGLAIIAYMSFMHVGNVILLLIGTFFLFAVLALNNGVPTMPTMSMNVKFKH